MDAASAALKIKKGFKVCDTNKDDNDMIMMIIMMMMIEVCDTNKDGCLSLGEIKKCVEKFGDKHPDLDIPMNAAPEEIEQKIPDTLSKYFTLDTDFKPVGVSKPTLSLCQLPGQL